MKVHTLLTGSALALALTSPLRAQVTEVSRTPIADQAQVTFGYLCDDRYVVRNDGTKPIDLEYGLEKGSEHTKLTVGARESVELNSPSKQAMELWMDGKLIARAMKEKVSCKKVQGNSQVTVNPLQVNRGTDDRRSYAYGMPYPFYDPWGLYYYGSFGWRPYYRPVIAYPVIIGGRGGGRRH